MNGRLSGGAAAYNTSRMAVGRERGARENEKNKLKQNYIKSKNK